MTSFSSVGKTGRGRGGGEGLFYWFLNIDAVCCICIMFIFRTFPWRRFHLLKCDIARIFPSLAIFDISQISHRPPNSRLKTPSQHEQDSFDKIRIVALACVYHSSHTLARNGPLTSRIIFLRPTSRPRSTAAPHFTAAASTSSHNLPHSLR